MEMPNTVVADALIPTIVSQEVIDVINVFNFGTKDPKSILPSGKLRQVKGRLNKSGQDVPVNTGPLSKEVEFQVSGRVHSEEEVAGEKSMIVASILQAFDDAMPISVIMDVKGSQSSTTPDLLVVYEAYEYFFDGRFEFACSVANIDPAPYIARFKQKFPLWIEETGRTLATQVVNGVLNAFVNKPSGLTPENAGRLMKMQEVVEFWCRLAGMPSSRMYQTYMANILNTSIRRNNGENKVQGHKTIRSRKTKSTPLQLAA